MQRPGATEGLQGADDAEEGLLFGARVVAGDQTQQESVRAPVETKGIKATR